MNGMVIDRNDSELFIALNDGTTLNLDLNNKKSIGLYDTTLKTSPYPYIPKDNPGDFF